jgi:hypothetical protein
MGFHRWLRGNCIIWHELEGCVVSRTALAKILSNTQARQFMQMRSQIEAGYTDYALAVAARISKIFPAEGYFMSHLPVVGYFSMFNGTQSHIHGLSHDKNCHAFNLFKMMLHKEMGNEESEVHKLVVGREFVFGKNPTTTPLKFITLNPNGIIENNLGGEEVIWRINNENLEFFKADGGFCFAFNEHNQRELKGKTNYRGLDTEVFLRMLV